MVNKLLRLLTFKILAALAALGVIGEEVHAKAQKN
jgi:hypothetical protein